VLLVLDDVCGCVYRHVHGHFPGGAVIIDDAPFNRSLIAV
jgi:hypothetical protein